MGLFNVDVISDQFSRSSCSNTPAIPNSRAKQARAVSFQSWGALRSSSCQDQISILSGPFGCHWRIVRKETGGASASPPHSAGVCDEVCKKLQFGNTLPTT